MWCFDSFFFDVGAFWMFSCVFLPAVSTLSPGCVLQMWPAGGSSSINSASLSIDLSSGETWRFLPPVLSQLVFVQKTAWGGGGHFLLAAITKQAQQSSSCTLTALPPSPPAVYRPLIPVQRPIKQRPPTLERSEGETRQLILRIRNNLTYLFYQQNFLCAGCDQLTCCSVLLASAWHLDGSLMS